MAAGRSPDGSSAQEDAAVVLLTHRGFCEGHVLRRHDTGLLLSACEGATARGRTLWCFDEHVLPPEALSLCSAALRPLHELETTAAEARWFGPSDPWRGALADRIGAWLGHGACARPCASEPSEAELGHVDAACEAHEAVELRRAAHSGRGLHVSRGCASGTLLLREEAFVAVLRRAHARTHCAHCLRPLGSPGCPCHQRAGECPARYCDATCRARAWAAGHALECGRRWAAVAPVTAVLALRALLLSPAAQAQGAQQAEAAGAEAAGGAWARVAAHAACHGLESHQARLGAARLSRLRLQAHLAWCAVGALLAARGHGEGALLTLLCQAETNTFAVSALLELGGGGGGAAGGGAAGGAAARLAEVRVAEAIFPRAAMVNHSCEPNTALVFRGRTLELRACRALAAGEQVLGCYGPQRGHAPRAARQLSLREQYYFECRCTSCAADGEGAEAEAAGRTGAARVASGGGGAEAERAVAAAAQLDALAFEACARDDFGGAARLVARAVALLRRVFPPESSQLAHELAKLGRLSFNASPDAEAARRLREAAAALCVCCGADEPEVAELRRLAAMCST